MTAHAEPLDLPEVLLIRPPVFTDERGTFVELLRQDKLAAIGISDAFVQTNRSVSKRGVLRGLHLQHPHGQGKLVSVLRGAIQDVAVDVRVGSPRFGRWCAARLTASGAEQLWIPPGFAHGFLALTDEATVVYHCTALYQPGGELSVLWSDPDIGIPWEDDSPILSVKDAVAAPLRSIPEDRLPRLDA